jgi:hypothetical protein
MTKCRVWYKPDGSVSVSHPDVRPHKKPDYLTMDEWIDKQLDDVAVKAPQFQGLEYDDIDAFELPARDMNRDKWRGSKGQKVKIDNTVKLRHDVTAELDAELAMVNPDIIKVIKLQRKLDKKEYD